MAVGFALCRAQERARQCANRAEVQSRQKIAQELVLRCCPLPEYKSELGVITHACLSTLYRPLLSCLATAEWSTERSVGSPAFWLPVGIVSGYLHVCPRSVDLSPVEFNMAQMSTDKLSEKDEFAPCL